MHGIQLQVAGEHAYVLQVIQVRFLLLSSIFCAQSSRGMETGRVDDGVEFESAHCTKGVWLTRGPQVKVRGEPDTPYTV